MHRLLSIVTIGLAACGAGPDEVVPERLSFDSDAVFYTAGTPLDDTSTPVTIVGVAGSISPTAPDLGEHDSVETAVRAWAADGRLAQRAFAADGSFALDLPATLDEALSLGAERPSPEFRRPHVGWMDLALDTALTPISPPDTEAGPFMQIAGDDTVELDLTGFPHAPPFVVFAPDVERGMFARQRVRAFVHTKDVVTVDAERGETLCVFSVGDRTTTYCRGIDMQ